VTGVHWDIGLAGFIAFAAYYIILKALIQFINVETRRSGKQIPAALSGLLA
jgi:hypothetical protein